MTMSKILHSFIVFEGLDGSGKSTQAELLAKELEKRGIDAVLTAEPTDREIGLLVRRVLRHQFKTSSTALALLYAADRNDHLYNEENGIAKLLGEGKTVISDRYFYSSLSYQGVTEDMAYLREINSFPHPEYVIYVDTPVDVCISRIDKRGDEKELFDRIDYLTKVRENFAKTFATLPDEVKFLQLDGTKDEETLKGEILSFLNV